MVDVKITPELLIDFNEFILDLRLFMTLNIAKLESYGVTPKAKEKLNELVLFCKNNQALLDLKFKEPVKNNIKYNSELLSPRLNELLKLIHSIISYASSILMDYYPKLHEERFKAIVGRYVEFRDKYGIN